METLTITINDDGSVNYSDYELFKKVLELSQKPTSGNDSFYSDWMNLWNEYAKKHGWRQLKTLNKNIKPSLTKARKDFPLISQWSQIMMGLEADPFFSGRRSDYKTVPNTLFFKKRYFDFYDAGEETQAPPKELALVSELDSILAGI